MGKKEFNLPELIEGISNQTDIGPATIEGIFDKARALMANYLANNPDRRIELNGLFIITMEEKPEKPWKFEGKDGVKPAHFAVKCKAHSGFLSAINANLPPDSPLKATK